MSLFHSLQTSIRRPSVFCPRKEKMCTLMWSGNDCSLKYDVVKYFDFMKLIRSLSLDPNPLCSFAKMPKDDVLELRVSDLEGPLERDGTHSATDAASRDGS